MGVKLNTIIKSVPQDLSELKGKRVAVDGMQMLFQILYNPYYRQRDKKSGWQTDNSCRLYYHLYGWVQKAIHFLNAQILPIIVFDGRPSTFKNLCYRFKEHDFEIARDFYKKHIREGNLTKAREVALSKNYMFHNCVLESVKLLKACGIPTLFSHNEAEAQCVSLQQQKRAEYVVSTDYDTVLYGATKIVRSITFSSRKKENGRWKNVRPKIEVIDVEKELIRTGYSRRNLIDISFLLGNDYFKGIKNVGPVTAEKSIKKFGSIPKMKEAHPHLFRKLHLGTYEKIVQEFLTPKTKQYTKQFTLQPFSPSKIRQILLEDHELSTSRTENYIKRLDKALEKAQKIKDFVVVKSAPKIHETHKDGKSGYEMNKFIRRRLDRANEKSGKLSAHNYSTGFIQALYTEDEKNEELFPEKKVKKRK